MEQRVENVNISPLAIMAALVFHTGEEETIKVQPDAAEEPIKTRVPVITLTRDFNGEIAGCIIPLKKIMKYVQNIYDVQYSVRQNKDNPAPGNEAMLITFEKRSTTATILGPTGNGVIRSDSKREELLKRLGL